MKTPIEREGEQIASMLKDGGLVVVVGARASNLPEKLRFHSQVRVWESSDNITNRELPVNTKVLVFTRWVGHGQYGRLMAEARKRHLLVFPALKGSGELKTLLTPLLYVTKQPESAKVTEMETMEPITTTTEATHHYPPRLRKRNGVTVEAKTGAYNAATGEPLVLKPMEPVETSSSTTPEAPETPIPTETAQTPAPDTKSVYGKGGALRRGVLKAFVVAHGDLTQPFQREAERLLKIAPFKTSVHSLCECLARVKKETVSGKGAGTPTPRQQRQVRKPVAAVSPAIKTDVQAMYDLIGDLRAGLDMLQESVEKLASEAQVNKDQVLKKIREAFA